MIQKKICMLGAFAVGKTSLIERYVKSIFSDRYKTTVGVRIHKRNVNVEGQEMSLVIWDLAGEDEFVSVRTSYLRGSAGYILVADCTRQETLGTAIELRCRAEKSIGEVPFLLLINKADRQDDWAIDRERIRELRRNGWDVMETSAKSGLGVEEAFLSIAGRVHAAAHWQPASDDSH